jgi:hypothetical protein
MRSFPHGARDAPDDYGTRRPTMKTGKHLLLNAVVAEISEFDVIITGD